MSKDSERNRLAVGFIEATTQYDYTDVPEHVQDLLNLAAEALGRWIETQGVYRIKPHQVRDKLEVELRTKEMW